MDSVIIIFLFEKNIKIIYFFKIIFNINILKQFKNIKNYLQKKSKNYKKQ